MRKNTPKHMLRVAPQCFLLLVLRKNNKFKQTTQIYNHSVRIYGFQKVNGYVENRKNRV